MANGGDTPHLSPSDCCAVYVTGHLEQINSVIKGSGSCSRTIPVIFLKTDSVLSCALRTVVTSACAPDAGGIVQLMMMWSNCLRTSKSAKRGGGRDLGGGSTKRLEFTSCLITTVAR